MRDADGDGVAETEAVFLEDLNSPFGMALVGDDLYVANADAIVRFPYAEGRRGSRRRATKVADLPAGPSTITGRRTSSPAATAASCMSTVGSNSNVAEKGMESEEGRAAIWEIDRASGAQRLFASGLRNPNGLAWEPATGALWTVVNERDELGSDLVPDYLTSVKEGAFYGWPWSYWGRHVDARVKPQRPDLVAKALTPDYALGAHVAPLGLAFSGARMPAPFSSGAFIGEHGSWNREPHSGYKVVFVPFANGKPSGRKVDFLRGFLECGWQGLRPPGRRGNRQARRVAGGRRRGQCGVARHGSALEGGGARLPLGPRPFCLVPRAY